MTVPPESNAQVSEPPELTAVAVLMLLTVTGVGVTIEIVPFTAGLYNGILQAFLHLEFPDPEDADVVFLEGATRDTLLSNDDAGEVTEFRELFETIRSVSMGPARTLAYLTNLAKST